MIRKIEESDAKEICDIYNYYVKNTTITFEEDDVSDEEMAKRIVKVSPKYPWLVYENEGKVEGYSYISAWKERSAYRYSAETSIYLRKGNEGKGIGTMLFSELLAEVKNSRVQVLIAGIALPNESSISFHEKFGFDKVGEFYEVGYKHNKSINVGYWELRVPH